MSVLQDADVAAHVLELQGKTEQQLIMRIEVERELIEWREAQIARLLDEVEAAKGRLYAAAAVLANREVQS